MTQSFSNIRYRNKFKQLDNDRKKSINSIHQIQQRRSSSCKVSLKNSPRQSVKGQKKNISNPKSHFSSYFIQKINKHIEFAGEFIKTKNELRNLIEKYPTPEDIYYVSKLLKSIAIGGKDLKGILIIFFKILKVSNFLKVKKFLL